MFPFLSWEMVIDHDKCLGKRELKFSLIYAGFLGKSYRFFLKTGQGFPMDFQRIKKNTVNKIYHNKVN
jgi:hypothetical protein